MILLTDEDPCDGCAEKVDDVYGRFCDIACGKHSTYIIKQKAYKAQLKRVVEWLKSHNRRVDTGIGEDGKRWFKHNDGLLLDNERLQALLEEVK